MPRPYTQLILVNVLLAFLFSTSVLGSPPVPAAVGAVAAGGALYLLSLRRRAREARGSAAGDSAPVRKPPEIRASAVVAKSADRPPE